MREVVFSYIGLIRGALAHVTWLADENMGLTDDDRILIENLYIFKGYSTKNLLKSFHIKVGF